MKNIRNYCIIAHIDHGKSTLADRFLEITGTVEMRKMKSQYLDQLDLERERGITIKMAPVRMRYALKDTDEETLANSKNSNFEPYVLNLIDTPGHPDFGYEVSRALEAVEGAVLLVDGTQGIQAQTLSNFYSAQKAGLKIIGAINKVDMSLPNYEVVLQETADLIGCDKSEIHKISGKTGQGVSDLLEDIIKKIPSSDSSRWTLESSGFSRALIFDSFYDDHKGIIAVVRVFSGALKAFDEVELLAVKGKIKIKEVGYFSPKMETSQSIEEGEIGYIVTGLKDPNKIKIGDTIISTKSISLTHADLTQTHAEAKEEFLYEELTYKLRGIIFNVKKKIGLGHKEVIYQNAIEEELNNSGIIFEKEKIIDIQYDDKKIGTYRPDFVIDNKIILELKVLPFIGKNEEMQVWTYLKGSDYKLALLVNFGSTDIFIKRIIYDIARNGPRQSAFSQRQSAEIWALPGYKEPNPVVFVSFFPDDPDQYDDLKKSLDRLRLNDSAFVYEPDFNEVLGRGFKGGFLGKLHFEITAQRIEKEFGIRTVTSFPSVTYKIKTSEKNIGSHIKKDQEGYYIIQNPKDLPEEIDEILEPMIDVEIVCPSHLLGSVLSLKEAFRMGNIETETLYDKLIVKTNMPLAELISDFDDRLKSVSGGFASFSYVANGFKKASLARMDILVAQEQVPGLSRILPKDGIERDARKMVTSLKNTLPGQQFSQAIQAKVHGRIVARETIPAVKKELGNFGKNGGDRTRKMKLWRKQKEGKKKLLSMARVRISAEDFKKLLSK